MSEAAEEPPRGSFERWFVGLVLLAGLVLRLYHAQASYLNPDEAMVWAYGLGDTLAERVRMALGIAHPPLHALVVQAFAAFGQGEWWLRLPSALAGLAAAWCVYRWLRSWQSPTSAVLGLCLVCFAPACLLDSVEVRAYALFEACAAAAILCLERLLAGGRLWWAAGLGVSLAAGVLTHYGMAWICLTLGVYALLRFAQLRPARKLIIAWAGTQLVALALYGWLYVNQLQRHRESGFAATQTEGYLRPLLFQAGGEAWPKFAVRNTVGVFVYLAAWPLAGVGLALAAACGLLALVAGRWRLALQAPRARALLCGLPFALGLAGGTLGFYPFGPSRHAMFLLPFAAALLSPVLARVLCRERLPVLAALVVAAAPLWWSRLAPSNTLHLPRAQMPEILDRLRANLAVDRACVVDDQTRYLLHFYLLPEERLRYEPFSAEGHLWRTPPADLYVARSFTFSGDDWDRFPAQVAQSLGRPAAAALLVASSGWASPPDFRAGAERLALTRNAKLETIGPFTMLHWRAAPPGESASPR